VTPLELTKNQQYHLVLADIAMAAAITACDKNYTIAASEGGYVPGGIRDAWLERTSEGPLRRQVIALANAGSGSLQKLPAEQLAVMAERYGVPLAGALSELISEHFTNKREAVLTYNK
jgi:hypothetical protein